jgi:hypothetical protein
MQQQPKQTIQHSGSTTIKTTRDLAGLLNIPVQSGDSTYSFVFDTGAGISTIMESFAQQLGLQFIPSATVPIKSGITGIPTQSQLAVAKELRIGTTLVRNALFLVFPDSALTFGGGVYKIRGIIGFPIIKEMGALGFRQDSLVVSPSVRIPNQQRNLAADVLKPYIFLTFNGQLLPFAFDTGAMETIFSNRFYTQHKAWIDTTGKEGTQPFGGTSGNKAFKGFVMPAVELDYNGKKIMLKKRFVTTDYFPAAGHYLYGNVGKDFIGQFQTMKLDFKQGIALFE